MYHHPTLKKKKTNYFYKENPNNPRGIIVQFPVCWEHVKFSKVIKNGEVLEVNLETAIEQLERHKNIPAYSLDA